MRTRVGHGAALACDEAIDDDVVDLELAHVLADEGLHAEGARRRPALRVRGRNDLHKRVPLYNTSRRERRQSPNARTGCMSGRDSLSVAPAAPRDRKAVSLLTYRGALCWKVPSASTCMPGHQQSSAVTGLSVAAFEAVLAWCGRSAGGLVKSKSAPFRPSPAAATRKHTCRMAARETVCPRTPEAQTSTGAASPATAYSTNVMGQSHASSLAGVRCSMPRAADQAVSSKACKSYCAQCSEMRRERPARSLCAQRQAA